MSSLYLKPLSSSLLSRSARIAPLPDRQSAGDKSVYPTISNWISKNREMVIKNHQFVFSFPSASSSSIYFLCPCLSSLHLLLEPFHPCLSWILSLSPSVIQQRNHLNQHPHPFSGNNIVLLLPTCVAADCPVAWSTFRRFRTSRWPRDSCASARESSGCMTLWSASGRIYR